MHYEKIKGSLQGVAVTPATPFIDSGEAVNYRELQNNVAQLDKAGIPVIIPCGNTGEYYSLSKEERIGVVETAVDAFDGIVLGGAGGSIKTVYELVNAYESAGADGVMLMHPAHTFQHQRGLLEYYRSIASATELGILLYKRGPEITENLLNKLSTRENVVGVKYAVNNVKDFSRAVENTAGDIVWSNGIAERYAPAFAIEGAEGFTSGIGNFLPEVPLALMGALRDNDWERARNIRQLARPFEDLRESPGEKNALSAANNVPAVKYAMELAGLYGGPVRPPITELSEQDQRRARQYYEGMQNELSELGVET